MSVDEDPIDELISAGAPDADPAEREPLDVGLLQAWRAGTLDAAQADAIATRLADDPEARATLAALAEPVPADLSARMRAELPAHPRRRVAPWTGALAAAAAVLFGVWLTRPDHGPLPSYELAGPFGGIAATRGAEAKGTYFLPQSQIEVVVRPRRTLSGMPPKARAFVSMPGAALRSLPAASLSRAASGAYTVTGAGRALLGDAPGTFTISVALAREASALDALEGRVITEATRSVRILSATLTYRLTPAPEETP